MDSVDSVESVVWLRAVEKSVAKCGGVESVKSVDSVIHPGGVGEKCGKVWEGVEVWKVWIVWIVWVVLEVWREVWQGAEVWKVWKVWKVWSIPGVGGEV